MTLKTVDEIMEMVGRYGDIELHCEHDEALTPECNASFNAIRAELEKWQEKITTLQNDRLSVLEDMQGAIEEIERLNIAIKADKSMDFFLQITNQNRDLKAENEKLKAEIEQRIYQYGKVDIAEKGE